MTSLYSTFEDHLSLVTQVLQTLKTAHLKIRINKYQFARNSVKLFGHLITPSGDGHNKKNIEAVTLFPILTRGKYNCAFLGLCNYYWRFMKNYSVLAGYLQQLLKKDVAFQRNSSQHEDFVALKERLTTVCILAYSSFDILFTLYTNTSKG